MVKSEFPPEIELLLEVARGQVTDDRPDRIATLAQAVEWERVVSLARRHRIRPMLFECLTRHQIVPEPNEVMADLETLSQTIGCRNLYMLDELDSVLRTITERDIAVLSYKGPSLAQLAYGDITIREFADLDLLVAEADFSNTVELLDEAGYQRKDSLPDFGQTVLVDRDTGISVDLHYATVPDRYPFAFSFSRLWDRKMAISLGGDLTVNTLHPADLLSVLAVHGTKHYWRRLEWLVSFAGLADRADIHWPEFVRRAKSRGCYRMVLLGFALARDLFGVHPPENISGDINQDLTVRQLAKRVIRRWFRGQSEPTVGDRLPDREWYLLQLLLMQGITAKATYAARIGELVAAQYLSKFEDSPGWVPRRPVVNSLRTVYWKGRQVVSGTPGASDGEEKGSVR